MINFSILYLYNLLNLVEKIIEMELCNIQTLVHKQKFIWYAFIFYVKFNFLYILHHINMCLILCFD